MQGKNNALLILLNISYILNKNLNNYIDRKDSHELHICENSQTRSRRIRDKIKT